MSDDLTYTASSPLEPGPRYGVLTPLDPGTRTLAAGSTIAPGFRALSHDIVLEKDLEVPLRDGTVIRADVFRPVGDEPVPVIVAWSPYGKGQSTSASARGVFAMVGLPDDRVSGLQKFEGPDPDYWCGHGYAICHPDPRGCVDSEGDSVLWDQQEGRDCHDLIEWLAEQPWCSGRVGMSGTSYLAASQWFTAAERPEHLCAINPWEGVSDVYRDLVMRGGIPDPGFAGQLQNGSFFGHQRKEDILTEVQQHPLVDDLWRRKMPALERIEVPAYVVASYSNTLHTVGTFRAWHALSSPEKWLRIHNSQEWPDYYDEANRDDLRRFFDHYLRGVDNDWPSTPRVRYSVLDLEGGDRTQLPATSFPPEGTTPVRHHLDARSRTMSTRVPDAEASADYDTHANPAWVSFTLAVDADTDLVGHPRLHLWAAASDSDDMDLFVLLQKLDAQGTPLSEFTVPNHNARLHDLTEHGATILRYKGAVGRLRASLRHLDAERSTDDVPEHTFDRVEKLTPGEPVELDIALSPIGLHLSAGQQLRLVVAGVDPVGPMMPGVAEVVPQNTGRHVLLTGPEHDSWLQLPVLHS